MNRILFCFAAAALALSFACASNPKEVRSMHETPRTPPPSTTAPNKAPDNPLLAPWSGPYGGVPPFDQVHLEQFAPALEAAMAQARSELKAIAQNPEPPTFQNTLAALEDSQRALGRVRTVYAVWSLTMSSPPFRELERELEPKLAAFEDEVTQNEPLFARIETVYESAQRAGLTPEQQRLAWRYHTSFVRSGARLDAAAKKRLAELNQKLASLYTTFGQNVLADEEKDFVVLEREADLAGLPDSVKAGASADAAARGLSGKWVISNTRSSVEPFLTYSTRRELRERVWQHFIRRGDNRDAHDNNATVAAILELRAERAKLLGYPTHAHWRLEDTMAKTPERALQLLEAVWTPAVERVREEVQDMQAQARREGTSVTIAPWDYRYWAERVRKAKYDLDENELTPYLQLEKLREGMFWVAGELFGFAFSPVTDVPVYHPDVRVWQVKNRATGQHVGLWYFDPYARPGKRSGAWMDSYRSQERFAGEVTAVVSNNANFVKPPPGQPVLISWQDAETLFHEFGHALHGLSSDVRYPSLSGTAVARDFVEFPSQLLEHWLSTPELLNRFAQHHQTGQPIPAELVRKIDRAKTFNQGFATVEYLSSALVDLKLHLAGAGKIDPSAFERDTLRGLGMPQELVMRHRTPQFGHVFAGDGYSAGYYSYLWADTLTADAFEAFTAAKGPYDRDVAARLREHVFRVGNTVDPAEAYRAFRGRDPAIDALMRKRGFPLPAPGAPATPRQK